MKKDINDLKHLLSQAEDIKDNLRQSGNIYDSRKEDTAYSRGFVRSEEYINNIIDNIQGQIDAADSWVEYEGKIRLGVSDRSNCVCCDGQHIFAKSVKWDENLGLPWGDASAEDLVNCTIPRKHSMEGEKIRIKILKIKS